MMAADTRSQQEEEEEEEGQCALPSKRKRDLPADGGDSPIKASKKGVLEGDGNSDNPESTHGQVEAKNGHEANQVTEPDVGDGNGEDEDEDDDEYEDDAEEDDDEDDDDEEDYEEGPVDLKGKGVLKDVKGKGKMIVEEDEDSDDSDDADLTDSDGEAGSGSDSDLSDDPLAEVDLDNILPSRTRRRRAQSGVVIAGDRRNSGDGGNSNA